MCVNLSTRRDGKKFRCRKCWECKERQISDWVGRCTAEARTATATECITLTYGPDAQGNKTHMRTENLVYADFSASKKDENGTRSFIKALRANGYRVRFFVVGEYGSQKGRSHWHVMLFFYGKKYPWPKPDGEGRIWIPEWTRGHVNRDSNPNRLGAVRYACKYIQKDETDKMLLRMSKKPALGAYYFAERARRMVKQGIAPQDLVYTFPEHKKKDGTLRKYYLHQNFGEKWLATYLDLWEQMRPGEHLPESEILDSVLDKKNELGSGLIAMEHFVEIRKIRRQAYQERLKAERDKRFLADQRREQIDGAKAETAKQRLKSLPVNPKHYGPGAKPWADQAERRRERHARVNVCAPGYDESKSLYTATSEGLARLQSKKP